jgi:uncharacterized protein (DUF2252 family)
MDANDAVAANRELDPAVVQILDSSARRSVDDRRSAGREARSRRPRSSFGDWVPSADRPDPIAVIEAQNRDRLQQLVPERHRRMLASPFAFYRGGAAIMAGDLGVLRSTELAAQLCGDAHLANFGLFGSPERSLVFDLNDFDETYPGPFEWDLARLAASAVLLGRDRGWGRGVQDQVVRAAVGRYRTATREFADQSNLDVWYSILRVDDFATQVPEGQARRRFDKATNKARANDLQRAVEKFTEVDGAHRRFRDDPPLLHRLDTFYGSADHDRMRDAIRAFFLEYLLTLSHEVQLVVARYRILDEALKVVGVGSVGTRCFIALGEGRDDRDLIILQIKEATESVLAPWWPASEHRSHGRRVVDGQRVMQAASDPFLGWAQMAGHDYYLRQFRDMKGSVDLTRIKAPAAESYLASCGWTLARAHARSGDPIATAAYMGSGDRFDSAFVAFAHAYADQVERDYEAFAEAASSGRIEVAPDPAA